MKVHSQNQILNQYISKLQVQFILIDKGLCPDWSRETHRRRRDSIYLILDGQGEIVVNGEKIYPKRNNMVLLPKNSRVSLYSENDTCYNKYWCDFIMQIDGISLFDVIDFPYMIELDDVSRALSLFERLDELHLKTDIASAFMIKSTLEEIIAMFLENDTREITHKVSKDPFADELNCFIDENISERLSVKTLADKMGFNEKYFIDLFKSHFGTTPAQYIKAKRMDKIKYELLYSDTPIPYLIEKINYSSSQKLNRDFKNYTGMTPLEFRQKFKG